MVTTPGAAATIIAPRSLVRFQSIESGLGLCEERLVPVQVSPQANGISKSGPSVEAAYAAPGSPLTSTVVPTVSAVANRRCRRIRSPPKGRRATGVTRRHKNLVNPRNAQP